MLGCMWASNAESSSPHTTGAAQMCRYIFALAQGYYLVKSLPTVVSVAKLSVLARSFLLLHVGFIICAQNSFRYCVCCRYYFLSMIMRIFTCRENIKEGIKWRNILRPLIFEQRRRKQNSGNENLRPHKSNQRWPRDTNKGGNSTASLMAYRTLDHRYTLPYIPIWDPCPAPYETTNTVYHYSRFGILTKNP